MNTLNITKKNNHYFMIDGDLTFKTINMKSVKAINFTAAPDRITIDLLKVNNSDSASLGLIIEWINLAKLHHKQLFFENIPTQLVALAKLSGIEQLLHMTEIEGVVCMGSTAR